MIHIIRRDIIFNQRFNQSRKVTLELLDTINHIINYVFFLLKANDMIKEHTITSTHYITLEGTSHLRNVTQVNYDIPTQFQVSITREVTKVKYKIT